MKRFFPYILISAVILVAVFGPVGAHLAHADSCWSVTGINLKACAANIGYLILIATSKVMALAGYFSDTAIDYSVVNFGPNSKVVVESGWMISRDIANLFFIFILLYIAIATILQLSGYGMKELLAKVIIIALLVNFSLMITRVIIDSSNILAMEFYSKMKVQKMENGKVVGEGSLSEALVAGINPQSLFNLQETDEAGTGTFKQGSQDATLMQIFIITSMGSFMFLVIAFVMFAAGVLFVIRSVILWILMILAPLAFLAMALPATKGYASQWWKKLFDQSFFAPVYLFLFYLVVKITSEKTLIKALKADNQTFGSAFGSPNNANVQLVLNFALLIVLTLACLIVAKQMGAVGASTVQAWGNKMKGAAQGYAGRIGKRYTGRAAAALERGLEGKGKVAGALRKIPFLQRGLAGVAQLKKKEVGAFEKQYGSYDDKTLQQLRGKFGTPREAQAAIKKILEKRGVEGPKAKLIEKENDRIKEIDQEIEKANMIPQGGVRTVRQMQEDDIVEFESQIMGLHGDVSAAGTKKRAELIVRKRKAEKYLKNIDNLEKEKKEIEVNRQRRAEQEGLEERLSSKIEASKQGKPPPAPAAKP